MEAQIVANRPVMSRGQQARDIRNIAYNSVISIETRHGFLYHGLYLRFSNLTIAQIEEITVLANSRVISRASGTFFDVLAFYENGPDATTSGVLWIPFSRVDLASVDSEVLTGINLKDERNGQILDVLEVQLKIGARTAGQATANVAAPTLTAYFDVSPTMQNVGPGAVRRFVTRRETGLVTGQVFRMQNFATAGQASIETGIVSRIFLNIDPSAVAPWSVYMNRDREDEMDPAVNEYIQLRNRRNPVDGWVIIDTSKTGLGGNGYNLTFQQLSEFALELPIVTAPAGGVLNSVIEYIGPFQ
jgi:hypothetical protein